MDEHALSDEAWDGASDVDWRSEARWHDWSWVRIGLVLLVGIGEIAAFALLLDDMSLAVGGAIGGGTAFVAILLGARKVQRQITDETGLSRWQIPVIARRLRKERLPADPRARLAMTILAQRQLNNLRQRRWWLPVMICVCVLLAGIAITARDDSTGILWLAFAVVIVLLALSQRRTVHRLERIQAHLSPNPDQ
jgi:asparagine N-glycosylation enzyme membrane subunit Stt3